MWQCEMTISLKRLEFSLKNHYELTKYNNKSFLIIMHWRVTSIRSNDLRKLIGENMESTVYSLAIKIFKFVFFRTLYAEALNVLIYQMNLTHQTLTTDRMTICTSFCLRWCGEIWAISISWHRLYWQWWEKWWY